MRQETLKFSAVWMCALIILLPVYSSGVFAVEQGDTINIVSIEGGDGVDGIRKSQGDFTKIEAEVFSSRTLSAKDIQLKSTTPGASALTFDTCSDISPYICTWQSSSGNLPVNAYSFYACVGSCDSCFTSSCKKRATIYVDGVPPAVELFQADTQSTNGGIIKLDYKIRDKSCLASKCSSHCSGISKAEIYDVDLEGHKILVGTMPIDTKECLAEGTYDFTASSVGNGERKLCLVPYDKFMQKLEINTAGTQCIAMNKDDTMPSFMQVRLMDNLRGYDLKYLNPSGTNAALVINLTASDMFEIKDRKLSADLSDIGGLLHDSIPCTSLGNGFWACVKSFSARVSEGGSHSIQVSAVDKAGNNNTQVFTFTLDPDFTAPHVEKITTEHELGGVGYLRAGTDIVGAIITESGSGFTQQEVFFDAGPDSNKRAFCFPSSGLWTCYINATASGGASLTATIHGKDDAGNVFSDSRSIPIDSQAPSIKGITVRNSNSNPFFVSGDDMLVTAYLSDNRAIAGDSGMYSALLRPIGFADPNEVNAESCALNESDDIWACKWTLMNLAPGDVKMKFNISDFVGNAVLDEKKFFFIEYLEPATGTYLTLPESAIEVYEVEGGEADYWEAKAKTAMPSSIDSSTTELIEHDVWIPVELMPRSGASIFSVELAGCKGNDFSSYAKNAILVRPDPRSNLPFVRITLNRGAIEVNQLVFNCALNIVSRHDDKISQVEIEEFDATVAVMPKDEYSMQVRQEVYRVSNSWLVKASWVESIGKIISLATKICGLISSVSSAIRDIVGLVGWGVQFCEPNPFCNPYAKAGRLTVKGLKGGETSLWNAAFQFCAYVQCSKTLYGKYLYGDSDYNGEKCDEDAGCKGLEGEEKKNFIDNKRRGWTGRVEHAVNNYAQTSAPVSTEETAAMQTAVSEEQTNVEAKRAECEGLKTAYAQAQTAYATAIANNDSRDDKGADSAAEEARIALEGCPRQLKIAESDLAAAQQRSEEAKVTGWEKARSYAFGVRSEDQAAMPEAERKRLGLQQSGVLGSLTAWAHPANSLILSLATGCIPGILSNLQKARQIECQYLSCIMNDVPAGMPMASCSKLRNYQWCVFVYGEIFQIVPLVGSIKSILNPILGMVRDPLTMVFGIFGYMCEFSASDSIATACHYANSAKSVLNIINVLEEIFNSKDLFKIGGADSCKQSLQQARQITAPLAPQSAATQPTMI